MVSPATLPPKRQVSSLKTGEFGYALSHAYGVALDNPGLIMGCVVGDGEAATGPCAITWHSHKFLNLIMDDAVLPILHLNGYKILSPTVLARISRAELRLPVYVLAVDEEFWIVRETARLVL